MSQIDLERYHASLDRFMLKEHELQQIDEHVSAQTAAYQRAVEYIARYNEQTVEQRIIVAQQRLIRDLERQIRELEGV